MSRIVVSAAAVVVLAGCVSTRNSLFVELDEDVRAGNYSTAVNVLEEQRDDLYGQRDQVVYYLDAGMLNYLAGDYRRSIEMFNEAERLIEEYFTRSISQAAASLLINDTVQDYPGEDFEDIYLNVFKALAFARLGDAEGAFVEIRRINNKLNLLEDKYQGLAAQYETAEEAAVDIESGESRFYNSALGRYLSLVLYRSENDFDSARIDWQEIQEAFAQQANIYRFPVPLTEKTIIPPEEERLSIVAFTGQAPVKRAETLWVVTYTDTVEIIYAGEGEAGRLIPEGYGRFSYPGVEEGFRFKFQVPRMELRGSDVESINVRLNGSDVGRLGMLEDMQQVALDTFEVRRPIIFLKTVIRTVAKGIIAERSKEGIQNAAAESGTALGLAAGIIGSIAADVAVEATEQADLRMSRYFPAFAHVGEFELQAGQHTVEVEYRGRDGVLRVDRFENVEVTPRGLNLVTSYYGQ